jgi:hypothetical protein
MSSKLKREKKHKRKRKSTLVSSYVIPIENIHRTLTVGMRLILVVLHLLLTIFAFNNLHPHLAQLNASVNYKESISAILGYGNDLIRLGLYHATCIVIVWFNRTTGIDLVRASGLFLIGELTQTITSAMRKIFSIDRIESNEITFLVVHHVLLLVAMLMTYRLADAISRHEKSNMCVELVIDDEHVEPVSV